MLRSQLSRLLSRRLHDVAKSQHQNPLVNRAGYREPNSVTRVELYELFTENNNLYRFIQSNYNISQHTKQLRPTPKTETVRKYIDNPAKVDSDVINRTIYDMDINELIFLLKDKAELDSHQLLRLYRLVESNMIHQLNQLDQTDLLKRLDPLLYTSRILYETTFVSKFVPLLIMRISSYNIPVDDGQLIQMLFLIARHRRDWGLLKSHVAQIQSIIEGNPKTGVLAIICAAYFKTMSKVLDLNILDKIIETTNNLLVEDVDLKEGDDSRMILLGPILKCVRYSAKDQFSLRDKVHKLCKLTNNIKGDNVLNSVMFKTQILKLMDQYRIYDPEIVEQIFDHTLEHQELARIKDIQYVLSSCVNLNHRFMDLTPKQRQHLDALIKSIATQVRDDPFVMHHLLPFMRCLISYNIYDDGLIKYLNFCLHNSTRDELMKKAIEYNKSLLMCHAATFIEHPSAIIKAPDDQMRRVGEVYHLGKKSNEGTVSNGGATDRLRFILSDAFNQAYFRKSMVSRRLAIGLSEMDIFQSDEYHISYRYVLSYQNYSMLIVCKNCKPPGDFDPKTLEPKWVPEGDKICIVYLLDDPNFADLDQRLGGQIALNSRLLTKLGYRIVFAQPERESKDEIGRRIFDILNHGD